MNPDEIFTKIVAKAINNGFTPFPGVEKGFEWRMENGNFWLQAPIWDFKQEKMVKQLHARNIEGIIFDHNFCKCLWSQNEFEWIENIQLLATSSDRPNFLKQFIQ